ncbi:MAG: hydroxyisourate hydrolase [Sciscionella sp.]
MSYVSTHILDTATGRPVVGLGVSLQHSDGTEIACAVTDADGRCAALGPDRLDAGCYRLRFDTSAHLGPEAFFPEVLIAFRVHDDESHYHVPLLLAPFAYSSYRGS